MRLFHNDYNEICHPNILSRMTEYASMQMPGYGEDLYCAQAADKIRQLCGREDVAVHFLVGGTQTNMTVIAAALRPHQAVIGAESAHIHVHETGAVEATGHKVIALPSRDGKLTAEQVAAVIREHRSSADMEHMAQPKMVYISNSTELGTHYSLAELESLSAVCKELGLYLFMDGARLGYALTAQENDVTMEDLARLCDVFYIGGTKVGAMFGEAVVITNPVLGEDFRYLIKQCGGMLAKGWLLGIQFLTLLEEDLYFHIAAHANIQADRIRSTLEALGYSFLVPGRTNQVFPILPDVLLDVLKEEFTFSEMHRVDEAHRAVRFCTSWATKAEDVDALCETLRRLSKQG